MAQPWNAVVHMVKGAIVSSCSALRGMSLASVYARRLQNVRIGRCSKLMRSVLTSQSLSCQEAKAIKESSRDVEVEDELASTEPGEQELATTEPETVPLQKEVEADEAGFEEEVVEEDELATTEDLAYVRASPPQASPF
eukprot:42797-Amphidinium_carterae.1